MKNYTNFVSAKTNTLSKSREIIIEVSKHKRFFAYLVSYLITH